MQLTARVSADKKTVALSWSQIAGAEGYLYTMDGGRKMIDGKSHFTMDGNTTSVSVGIPQDGKAHTFGVNELVRGDTGSYTFDPNPSPPPPPPIIVVPSGTATILRRGYLLKPGDKPPLVVAMGHTGPPGFQRDTLWMEASDRCSLALAIPNGQDGWSGHANHVAYLKAEIPKWIAATGADATRVYLAGFSAGASMALYSANEGSLNIAGVAAVSGWLNKNESPTMKRTSPCRLMQFMGTTDAATYQGTAVLFSLREVSQKFAALNGCAPNTVPASSHPTASVTRTVWPCDVEEHLITHGTHQWPGGPGITGPDAEVDATQLIADWVNAG